VPGGAPPPCGPTTLTQSSSQTITPGNSTACIQNGTGYTLENGYWRAFALTDMGIAGAFAVCEVQLAIESATANLVGGGGGTQPLTVLLFTSDPAFPGGALTQIGSADIGVADQTGAILGVPVTGVAPAGSQLVVEISIPDGTAAGNMFLIGSNAEAQTGPSYISAPDPTCDIPTPMPTGDVGHPDMHIVLNVIGQELLATPAALAVDASGAGNQNGVLEMGETATIEPSWTNSTDTIFTLLGLVSDFSGPNGAFYIVDDGTADYGAIAGNATADCATATTDCMAVHITGVRPAQHFDAQLTEQPTPGTLSAPTAALPPKVWTLHVGESFTDVPMDNQFYKFIETIFHNGVTGGCGLGTEYCPSGTTLRKQMAVFLLKGKLGSSYLPPDCTGTVFTDVPCTGGPFDPWIEDLADRGITGGCGGGNYCPDNFVTRAQMAVFLLKSEQGSNYLPPDCTGMVFTDVPCTGGPFDPWIEDLAARNITGGCGGGAYCPDGSTTRGQMAVFLTKTFGLLLYGP
jgi:hypothetical protein